MIGLEIFSQLSTMAIVLIVIIVSILIVALISTVVLRGKYREMGRDILNPAHREAGKFDNKTLNKIIADYKIAAKRNKRDVNTQAIIEKHVDSDMRKALGFERFVNKSVSLMIVLGLVGTFFGLTMSISELVKVIQTSSSVVLSETESIAQGLMDSLSGMSVAFSTSLFGISGSVIMTIFNTALNVTHERITAMIKMEEYLDNILAKSVLENIIVDSQGNVVAVGSSIDKFSNIIEDSFKDITDALSDRLSKVTDEMANTAEMIQGSVAKFEGSLDDFSENVRDFTEFNHHLKDNIQRMSLSFTDFGDELKGNSKVMADSSKEVGRLADAIDKLSTKV